MLRDRATVVQEDCVAAANGADAEFTGDYHRRLVELYGGMAAFITVPVFVDGRLAAAASVHELGAPRTWSGEEVRRTEVMAGQVQTLLTETGHPTWMSNDEDLT